MHLGELIANILAALLLMCVLAVAFFAASQPLWPDREAKMVILIPPDVLTTASIKAPTHPRLPDAVDTRLVKPRPERD
ncbi:polymerase [Mesorhizobium sp.]|uniref:polymerase n=1 Tax=Mesorhizobium sp. TaxID=1871066 RepID=UPI000FE7CDAB|nr:polymerase [Mesorhizobium sp.]RWM06974.1 MAG: polymerase [Mesorhizobium sp.]